MWSWDRVAPVSKDAWFKTGPSLAAHAESVIEVRRQDPKKIRWQWWGEGCSQDPSSSQDILQHSYGSLPAWHALWFYDTADHQQQSGDLGVRLGLPDNMSIMRLDTDTDMSWRMPGHVFRLSLATLNMPNKVSYSSVCQTTLFLQLSLCFFCWKFSHCRASRWETHCHCRRGGSSSVDMSWEFILTFAFYAL